MYRSRNGLPAENYWQQQVDYILSATLEPAHNRIRASAQIRYQNNSPDQLPQLFFALDHNALQEDSAAAYNLLATGNERSRKRSLARMPASGFEVSSVTNSAGHPLEWHVRDTILQVSLPQSLDAGKSTTLKIDWSLTLTDKVATGARSGYESLADGARIFVAAQWFPRALAYTDYAGWQLKPFLQQGEFSTEFGNYQVTIEAPSHYTVAASGILQNAAQVLDDVQLQQWKSESQTPVWMIDPQAAIANRVRKDRHGRKRWQFSGEDLRDFAFATSAAFQWQLTVDQQGRKLQQFFPVEAGPLWERFGLPAIAHTLDTFDHALAPLQMPSVSIVNAAGIGMEYPGLATIATRPERVSATAARPPWDALTKYDFIGSVIHEVGHNYLPMQINTDEREWAWLDEGLVSFIEYRAEHSWEPNFDVIYGEPRSIVDYTASAIHQPIMSSADSLHGKIDNAYNKTASVLNILRHLVLEPEVFDAALADFAHAWQGKRPVPGDLFRALETAAATDLSWFWRSWFYESASIDLAIRHVRSDDIDLALTFSDVSPPPPLALTVGGINGFVVERDTTLADQYSRGLPPIPTRNAPLSLNVGDQHQWYTLVLANRGGGILPIPLQLELEDGSRHDLKVPAQAWMRAQRQQLTLQLPLEKRLDAVCIDPLWLLPDTQRNNNCVEIKTP
ncbi:M1 family metallopeptidase [Microbulbifer hydrolyticus]|uniref:Peptidase M1 membrane alanine aminopeptidase domain-containing protein n=1 Tax=Microbulbifer hydrolyticus TaxID=48074 RepID=A0A6P1TC11_9GAMM|nr:M1 family metallopeptidase [Microbulbifer hydrolyticus]MBB5210768.1 hypothetical protein [Microbulbifer hydrolyticus]QHQ38789.1 hypothetical protein GTQ55_07170 [Microbulbifer hydrolyticus]